MINKTWFESGIKGDGIALLAGAAMALSFAPFSFFLLPFICLAALLLCWLDVPKRTGLLRGLLFGIGLYGVGTSWVYNSIHVYGQVPPLTAAGITALFVLTVSIIPAYCGYLFTRFLSSNTALKIIGAFPAMWLLFEWIKSWIFTGFPWMDVGYTQLGFILRNYAPYVCSYGISYIVALGAALLVYAWLYPGAHRKRALIGFALIWVIAPLLGLFHFTKPAGDARQVTIIQGDIPQTMKWDPKELINTLGIYRKLTEQHWDSNIIVWPEGAAPALKGTIKPFLHEMSEEAKQHDVSIILGLPTKQIITHTYHNSLTVLGNGQGNYHKMHLVPFGEFVPAKDIFEPIMENLGVPMSDFGRGRYNQASPVADGLRFTPTICYESAFSGLVRMNLHDNAFIVTLSDDVWFGDSWAVDQHLQMTQMRALETGRYAVFANNTGSSAIINDQGRIIMRAPKNTRTTLTSTLVPMEGHTPWNLAGLNFLLALVIYLITFAVYKQYLVSKEKG